MDVAAVRRLGLALACQLLFCHLFTRCDGASACNPAETSPVEPTRPHLQLLYHLWQCDLSNSRQRSRAISEPVDPGRWQ